MNKIKKSKSTLILENFARRKQYHILTFSLLLLSLCFYPYGSLAYIRTNFTPIQPKLLLSVSIAAACALPLVKHDVFLLLLFLASILSHFFGCVSGLISK